MAKARKITGTPVAPGLAMGPVHVVRATPRGVPAWSIRESEIEDEIARLECALGAVVAHLDARRAAVAAHTNERDAEILALHRVILQDPSALERVEARIREERVNAEVAVQSLIAHLERAVGALEGDNVRGYGADMSDPWRSVLDELMQSEREELRSKGELVVLAASELTPHVVTFLDRERVLAVVTERGGRFSHGAVLARSLGFPCLVEVPNLLSRLEQGMRVIVDGDRGTLQLEPGEEDVDVFLERRRRRLARLEALAVNAAMPAITPDGRRFFVQVNVESLRDLDTYQITHTDGIGLLRTEFLYLERSQFPSEEEQYRLYRRAVERQQGRPATLRTLDIGGDKQLPYFKTPHEVNPQLGWRGLRVSLEWQDLLRVQLRAALRASAHGKLQILLPMVTSVEEVRQTHEIFDGVKAQLLEQGYEIAEEVPVGLMVEVPSSVLILDLLLAEVDFVSVGTNDMTQYVLAADRDNPWVSRLYDPLHPAVLRALQHVATTANAAGKHCSVCGEMAGDYATALLLLGMGFDGVSVAPNFVSEVKYAVRETSLVEAQELAREALTRSVGTEIHRLLEQARRRLHERGMRQAAAAADPPSEQGEEV